MLLYEKKVKQWIFQKLLQLATDDRSDKKFLLTSKLCPLPRGYIHVLNHEKNCIKSRLQRDFFETCNKWVK